MQVTEVDPEDEDELRTWWALQHASRSTDWPEDAPLTFSEVRGIATGDFGEKRFLLALAGDSGGPAVGCSILGMPFRHNTWTLELGIQVHPEHRRRGAGRALALHAEEVASREGRRTIEGGYEARLAAPTAAAAFAESFGFEEALRELRRDISLPVDPRHLDHLEASCAPLAAGYEIVTWQAFTPDELVEGMLKVERAMRSDIPHGDFERESEQWDETRLRAAEETVAAMNVLSFHAGAVGPGGLVAHTGLGVPAEAPEHGRQWGTVVLDGHRGHRLGTLVKIANLRAVMRDSPATRKVSTWNGESNDHMSRVNDALGFVVTGRSVLLQKRLA